MFTTKFLLWFCAIGCGLLAGTYFAFSTFIMTALGRIEPFHSISAMKSINSTILRSLFMPLFFGTTVASAVLAIIGLSHRGQPGGTAMVAGGLIYVVGMFVCTVFFNVPLNNALGSAAGEAGASIWARYLKEWTMWNHVRTISSATACALYIRAIASQ
jgi:uncharacterized membrane protein